MPKKLFQNQAMPARAYRGRGRKFQRKAKGKLNAYASTRKRNMVNAQRPMVETKSRTTEEVAIAVNNDALIINPMSQYLQVDNDDALTQIPQVPFLTQIQGLDEDQMIGLSNYTRWLKCKVQIKLPEGVNAIQHNADLYMVHGWVKAPLAKTSFTTIKPNEVTPAILNAHIASHVKDFFDQREDKLRFIPKQNTNLKILGYKRIKPNRNGALGVPSQVYGTTTVPTGFKIAGGNPIINYSCTWKVMRKIHYTKGAELTIGAGPAKYPTLFNNSGYLPFLVVYNPTFAQFVPAPGGLDRIQITYNSCCWYSDQ